MPKKNHSQVFKSNRYNKLTEKTRPSYWFYFSL